MTRRRRQLAADRDASPMPARPRPAGDAILAFGRAGVVLTVGVWAALVVSVGSTQLLAGGTGHAGVLQTLAFLGVVSLLAASALAYEIGRLGFYYRTREHRRVPRQMLDEFFDERTPTLTLIVPSYQEEPAVIRMTLLSAALQEYPDLRVVLLIDDPPEPRYAEPRRLLHAARALPRQIEDLLADPRAQFDAALERYEATWTDERGAGAHELRELAGHFDDAASWVGDLIEGQAVGDHNEQFFARHILGQLVADFGLTAAALRSAAAEDPQRVSASRVGHLYRRLAWTFRAEVRSFERKRYLSLSHEPNKAMNLNSYIGLMGGRFRELDTPMGVMLAHADQDEASFVVPDSDYVLTLDADSVLVPEYALRLVYLLEQREHAKDAVAQTPYSAFPGAATRIERIAGATTDLQHIIHQGMTFYGASFWVGANAVLRKAALDQIVETEYIGGWPIHRYIRDRTLIEDTESTIDLAAHGWGTYNYPERLAYSATPADFGSLCIQRHRWANGGLLIVPRLLQCIQLRRKRGERTTIGELLLRLNYMASTFWCSVSVLFLLLFPFNGHLLSPLTFAIPVPYFAAMATDLRYCGYKPLDILRVYGFNLLLLPVNLAGSLSSIAQGLTGAKGRFRRTPKVRNRTVPAFTYVVLPYVVVAVAVLTLARAYDRHLWWNAIFAVINTVLGTYAIVAFIGIRNSIVDVWLNVVSWLYKPASAKRPAARKAMPTPIAHGTHLSDWESVLYIGSTDDGESRPARAARALPAATVAAAPADAGAPAEPHGILDRDSYLEDPELVVKETGLQPR